MKEYFDFDLQIVNGKPKFKISLKKEFRKNTAAFRKSGYPFSGVELGFYTHHLDDTDLAHSVWCFRKSLCSLTELVNYYREHNLASQEDFEAIDLWLHEIKKKTDVNRLAALRSESARRKMSEAGKRNAHLSSIRLKNLWTSKREELEAALFNPEVTKRRVEAFKHHLSDPANHAAYMSAMRNPARIEKISDASKRLWKTTDPETISRMRNNWSKKFEYRDKKMNAPEYKIATILDTLDVQWEYEPIVRCKHGFFQPDFVINGKHVIECYGLFWHAHPEKYRDDEILFSTRTAGDQRAIDEKRINALKSIYRSVTILWEDEILCESIDKKVKELINEMD